MTNQVKLLFPDPPEFECSSEWAAFVATEEFAIQCSVHANPQVDIDALSWHVGDVSNNSTEIRVGNPVDGLSANVSVSSVFQGFSLNS